MLNDQVAGVGWGMICFQKDTIFMPREFHIDNNDKWHQHILLIKSDV